MLDVSPCVFPPHVLPVGWLVGWFSVSEGCILVYKPNADVVWPVFGGSRWWADNYPVLHLSFYFVWCRLCRKHEMWPRFPSLLSFFLFLSVHCPVSSAGPNITLEGQYYCFQGPGISLHRLCDFTRDCPLGDDEGSQCREYRCAAEDQLLQSALKRKALRICWPFWMKASELVNRSDRSLMKRWHLAHQSNEISMSSFKKNRERRKGKAMLG